jgi:LmbE family N-acetylglucosaminyl deacetylase
MKTLVIAAHADDEAISCGGLIRKRVNCGHEVHVAVMFERVYDYGRQTSAVSQQFDALKAKDILGYKKLHTYGFVEGEPSITGYYKMLEPIEKLLQSIAPDEVVIHANSDRNQDHKFMHEIMDIALRPANLGGVTRVLEMLALDGGGPRSTPTYFVSLDENEALAKVQAVAAYRKEARLHPHPRSPENVKAFMSMMGSAVGCSAAEGFVLRLEIERENCGDRRIGVPGNEPS